MLRSHRFVVHQHKLGECLLLPSDPFFSKQCILEKKRPKNRRYTAFPTKVVTLTADDIQRFTVQGAGNSRPQNSPTGIHSTV
jgi:hypothetical protein